MQTRYFKFADQASAFALAASEGLTGLDESGNPMLIRFNSQYAIDVVGTVYEPTGGTVGSDGDSWPEMAAIPGWHVNVRILDGTPLPAAFEPFEVFPVNPTREFL